MTDTNNAVLGQMFGRIAVWSGLIAVGVGLASMGLWWAFDGSAAALSAAIGAAMAGLAIVSLAAAMYWTRNSSTTVLAATVLGGFLVLMIVVIGGLFGLAQLEEFPRAPLAITAAVSATAMLLVTSAIVLRARVPYVDS